MSETSLVGRVVKEITTATIAYQNCRVSGYDPIGITFEITRTIAEGGNVETVQSSVLIPWVHVQQVIIEDRT